MRITWLITTTESTAFICWAAMVISWKPPGVTASTAVLRSSRSGESSGAMKARREPSKRPQRIMTAGTRSAGNATPRSCRSEERVIRSPIMNPMAAYRMLRAKGGKGSTEVSPRLWTTTVAVSAPIMAPSGILRYTATRAPMMEIPSSSASSSVRNLPSCVRLRNSPATLSVRRRGERVEQRLQGAVFRQPVYQRDHTLDGFLSQLGLNEVGELLPQLFVGDGVLRRAGGMTDVLGARLAALEPDHGLRFALTERTVFDHQDAVAQSYDVGAVDLLVGELPVAGGSFYPGDRTRENDAELPLQPPAGVALIRQFYD